MAMVSNYQLSIFIIQLIIPPWHELDILVRDLGLDFSSYFCDFHRLKYLCIIHMISVLFCFP